MSDSDLPWRLAGGTIGLPNGVLWLRTAVGGVLWMTAPLYVARWLGRHGRRRDLHALLGWWARGVARWLALSIEVAGEEHINPKEQYVVAPLHEGFADVVALLHLPLEMRFVVRDELLTWRRLGPYLRDAGHIAVCPEEGLRSYRHLVRAARQVFAQGESLVIFPQGGILGIEAEFVRGAFALARTLQRPLLPVALTGSHRVWEYPYTPSLRYGERITLHVFPPISAEECAARDVDELRLAVQHLLKTAALSGTMAPPRHFVPARDGYWDGYAYRIDPAFAELAAHIDRHRRQRSGEGVRAGSAGDDAVVGGHGSGTAKE